MCWTCRAGGSPPKRTPWAWTWKNSTNWIAMTVYHPSAMARNWTLEQKRAGRRVGLVPTMGALHEGHMALVRHARNLADAVAVTIFVNPTQFGPNEDYQRYPRNPEEDVARLAAEGVEMVFAPDE